MRNNEYVADYEPVTRPRKIGWWETENAGPAEWRTPATQPSATVEWAVTASPVPGAAPQIAKSEQKAVQQKKNEGWVARRGHALSFAGLFLFTAILYFRPYELFPSLSALSTMAFWAAAITLLLYIPSQLITEGNLTARPREVTLIFLLSLTGLLSIPLAIDRSDAWTTFNDTFIKAVVMFIVMINVVRTEQRLRRLIFLSIAVGVVLGASALRDFQSGNLTVEGYRVQGAIGGMFSNPNDMALYLVTVIPLAFSFCLAARSLPGRLILASSTLAMVGGLMVTYSRGGFLGLIAVACVLVWKLGRRNRFLISSISVLCGAAFIAVAPGGYGRRLLSIFIPSLDPVGSSSARKELLMRSLLVAARHPLLGIGMGNFHIVSIGEHVSHNAYTQVAAEMGLAALVIYVIFMLKPLKGLRAIEDETFLSRVRATKGSYYLTVGMQASIIGYMVSSFFGSVAYQWYIYYLVGYAVCFRRIYEVRNRVSDSTGTTSSQGVEQVG
jgi:putative inorganic carbon (HCO3(-)) transporter